MASPASRCLADVAEQRGLPVRRLSDEVVLCGEPPRRMLFHGLIGAASGRSAHVLCSDGDALRRQLARANLAVWRDGQDDSGGSTVEVAVVGSRPVAISGDSPGVSAAGALAVAAVMAIPDLRYAGVRLRDTAGELSVETVEPAFQFWVAAGTEPAYRVAEAIIELEFGGRVRRR